MIRLVPTTVQRVPGQLGSMGVARLEYDSERLILEKIGRFSADVFRALPARSAGDLELILEELGWSDQQLVPDVSVVGNVRRPRALTKATVGRVVRDMELLQTLALGDPDRTAEPSLREFVRLEAGRITESIVLLVQEIAERHGVRAAALSMQHVRQQLVLADRTLRTGSLKLREAADQLGEALLDFRVASDARREGRLPRFRLRPSPTIKAGMTSVQAAALDSCTDRLFDVADRCVDAVQRWWHGRVVRRLLGDRHRPGLIESVEQEIGQRLGLFEQLAGAMERDTKPASHSVHPFYVVSLVESLDAPLRGGGTLNQVFDTRLAAAGCSVPQAAERLWNPETALRIDERVYLPSDYPRLPFQELYTGLQQWMLDYLSDEPETPQDGQQPGTSALARLRSVDLGDAALEANLKAGLQQLVRLAAPYIAPFDPAVQPEFSSQLFVHHAFREPIQRWLATTDCRLAAPLPNSQGIGPCDLESPYVVELVRFAFNVPGGSLWSFHAGHHANRMLEADGQEGARCLGGRGKRSFRWLEARPAARETDAERLFDALIAAECVYPLTETSRPPSGSDPVDPTEGEPCYVLEFLDPGFDRLFYSRKAARSWVRPCDLLFKKDLPEFRTRLSRLFPGVRGWGKLWSQLAMANHAETVCSLLKSAGVVESDSHGLIRLATCDVSERHARWLEREGLLRIQTEQLMGMPRDRFVRQLVRDDWFYVCCLFTLTDAYAAGRIALPRLTDYARDVVLRLEQSV